MDTKYQYHGKFIILFYFIFPASCITILLTTNIQLVLSLFGYLLHAEFEVLENEQLLRVVPAKEYVNTKDCYTFLFISDLSNASIAVNCTFHRRSWGGFWGLWRTPPGRLKSRVKTQASALYRVCLDMHECMYMTVYKVIVFSGAM